MTFNNDRLLQMTSFLGLQSVIALSLAYTVFCGFLGPHLMKDRKPFSLRIPLILYNSAQIVMNAQMFHTCFAMLGIELFKFWTNVCDPITAANLRPSADEQVLFAYTYYYINKIVDLLDTVFFVLRKKTAQTTVHHIFHHTTMLICSHITVFHLTDEEINLKMMAINACSHLIMHIYYFMSGLGPTLQKYLYLKKYVTIIQIIEIVSLVIMLVVKLTNCHSSIAFVILWLTELIILFVLFTNFVWNTYLKEIKDE
ncbi:very long chain fatty acid elongase 1 [Halyomorpha halys]|uniref:very long chain fatty acid elongase 1 n=1 Tax=Halyomorpha halys TaxID=286706 RepID=UPI0006D51DD4|nr:elongation of very long chain fatty acids protein 1-like [Halyomorpha halys]XP_014272637.1 elongation of very long chain fatty acids protein 1-like [Halyomorpha halys]